MAKEIELVNGTIVRSDDVDTLIAAWAEADKQYQLAREMRTQLSKILAAQTPDSDSRTRRVEGHRRRCVIEMPPEGYDNAQLVKLWKNHLAKDRDRALRITKVEIKKREFDKLQRSALPPALKMLVKQIQRAATGPAGNPRITKVEDIEEERGLDPISGQGRDEASEAG